MDAGKSLKQKKRAVDTALDSILPEDGSVLSQAMRYAVLSGGKRFRPLLTISAGESFGADQKTVLPFACAIELIHNYSLIHDDLPCLDNDDFRRGKPACHKAYGEDIALLAGDGLLTLAFELMAGSSLKGEAVRLRGEVIVEVSRSAGVRGMIGGQMLDITLTPVEISKEEFQSIIEKKTASLILASVKTGALLGQASLSQMDAVCDYGKNIGLAFQTRDDILDSEEDVSGRGVSRPNSITVYGYEKTKERLARYISLAIAALGKISLDTKELKFLAEMLLKVKKSKENEKNTG